MVVSALVKLFLATVAWSEGTSTSKLTQCDGYDVIVSGIDGPEVFTDFSRHPFAGGRPAKLVRTGLLSTASGRYQIILPTWRTLQARLALPDFGFQSQDEAAAELIHERAGAIAAIESGRIAEAVYLCSTLWASLPGSTAGQGGKSMEALLQRWQELAGGGSGSARGGQEPEDATVATAAPGSAPASPAPASSSEDHSA